MMTEELFREKKELVQRLNAMQERIAAEIEPVAKVRRKVEWMEEKERCVELLNKVPHPPPNSLPRPDEHQLTQPVLAQMSASLQDVLNGSTEADDLSGELTPASNSDGSSREVSETDDASRATPRHPWALTRARSSLGASWNERGSFIHRNLTRAFSTMLELASPKRK